MGRGKTSSPHMRWPFKKEIPLGPRRKPRREVTQISMWDLNPVLCELRPSVPTTGWLVPLWEDRGPQVLPVHGRLSLKNENT